MVAGTLPVVGETVLSCAHFVVTATSRRALLWRSLLKLLRKEQRCWYRLLRYKEATNERTGATIRFRFICLCRRCHKRLKHKVGPQHFDQAQSDEIMRLITRDHVWTSTLARETRR